MVTALEAKHIVMTVSELVAKEEIRKRSMGLRPLSIPATEELARRRKHLAATEQLRRRLGKIDIQADELVRLGRERSDRA